MSVASWTQLVRKLASPTQALTFLKNGQLASGTHLNSEWISTGKPPAASTPGTTAAIPDRTTTGALGQVNRGGTEQRAWLRRFGLEFNSQGSGGLMLVDRLAHVGGLSGTVTTPQTVSTPALTRFTSGDNVFAAIEMYVAIGGTGTTATISYTNQAATAGQVSPAIVVGGGGFQQLRTVLPFSYASGDTGVQAVASVTLAATTGSVGNFGVTMFRPLLFVPWNTIYAISLGGTPQQAYTPMPIIPDDACLQLMGWGGGQIAAGVYGEVCFFED